MATIAESKNVDISNMSFSEALIAMKQGQCVARKGWNGKGMFVFRVPGSTFVVNRAPLLGIFPEGTEVRYQSHLDLRTADGSICTWNPSQTDMEAKDWCIVLNM